MNFKIDVSFVKKDYIQFFVAIEELSELQKAITKLMRFKDVEDADYKDILVEDIEEEIADVLIVIEELIEMLDINEKDIQRFIDFKLQREKHRRET